MRDGERRRLVFTNLVNGIPVRDVMGALHMSEKEVMDDFRFVAIKLRSYRFERAIPILACATIAEAQAHRAEFLFNLSRLGPLSMENLPKYTKIETLPFMDNGGSISDGERAMLELRRKNGL